jgi:DUF4097 and DUF4098 domain-containing protein YvlB
MTRLHLRFFPALCLFAVLGAGCDINVGEHGFSMDVASGKAQDEWTRTYTIAAGGRLEVVNINGTINVSTGDGPAVEVRAERIAKASNDDAARELLKKVEIVETASGDSVRIQTRVPKMSWGRSGHEVRYFVKVPKGLSLTFETVNGGVRLENVDGRITASTTNGGVRGRGLRGAVKADTTNGGVDVDMAEVTAEIALETTNGGVRLHLPENAKASLEARCTNGGISVEDSLPIQTAEKSRRQFRGDMNGGGHRVSLETTNGGIRISGSANGAPASR